MLNKFQISSHLYTKTDPSLFWVATFFFPVDAYVEKSYHAIFVSEKIYKPFFCINVQQLPKFESIYKQKHYLHFFSPSQRKRNFEDRIISTQGKERTFHFFSPSLILNELQISNQSYKEN
jgi:hypothetical protein